MPETSYMSAAPQMKTLDWFGLSGPLVPGEAVAQHLFATAELMRRDGWNPQLYGLGSDRQIRDALRHTAMDGRGDADTSHIARQVMEAALRTATGAPYVDYEVWAEKPQRTLDEILHLLKASAFLARQCGPRPTV
ncbi:hypothetical protein ABZY44_23740 [Streptomyces sp. NPDC006544]|uniref:DUF6197 family protein n=1 Tax=Streptomyces sp. NPDC006544 TaxID=3154583 RepID=UPI0033A700A8